MTGRAIPDRVPYDANASDPELPYFISPLGIKECSTETRADRTYEVKATGRDTDKISEASRRQVGVYRSMG